MSDVRSTTEIAENKDLESHDSGAAIQEALLEVEASIEFANYQQDLPAVKQRIASKPPEELSTRIEELLKDATDQKNLAESERHAFAKIGNRRAVLFAVAAAVLLLVSGLTFAVQLGLLDVPVLSEQMTSRVWIVPGLFGLTVSTALLIQSRRLARNVKSRHLDLGVQIELFESMAKAKIAAEVKLEYTRILNELLSAQGYVVFPSRAPRLVELNDSETYVSSAATERVARFIAGHDSSAIGIAGPRGVGKSTLMQKVAKDVNPRYAIQVSAPVQYERLDLLRRLGRAVAVAIAPGHVNRRTYKLQSMERRNRLANRLSVLVALVGALLGATLLLQSEWFSSSSAESVSGTTVFAFALLTTIVALSPQVFTIMEPGERWQSGTTAAQQLAMSLLDDLDYQSESSTSSTSAVKLTQMLQHEGMQATKMSTNQLGVVDLVDRIRTLLETAAREAPDRRVLVLIDELDKLPNVGALISIINSIKDIMHLPGVHFIVSVSDEALDSFQMRGIGARDAFDSSFDLIFNIPRLSLRESMDVLASRVAAFPWQLTAFAHVWSGGLPRDLLRAARSCVEINAEYSSDRLPWRDIAQKFLNEDIQGRAQVVSRGQRDREDGGDAPIALEHLLEAVGTLAAGPDLEVFDKLKGEASGLYALAACCAVALDLLREPQLSTATERAVTQLSKSVANLGDGGAAKKNAVECAEASART